MVSLPTPGHKARSRKITYVYMDTHVYVYIFTHVCICTHTHTQIYTHRHIHTQEKLQNIVAAWVHLGYKNSSEVFRNYRIVTGVCTMIISQYIIRRLLIQFYSQQESL